MNEQMGVHVQVRQVKPAALDIGPQQFLQARVLGVRQFAVAQGGKQTL